MEKYKARQDLSIYPVKAAFSHSWWPDQFEGKGGRTHKSSQMILLSSPEKKGIFLSICRKKREDTKWFDFLAHQLNTQITIREALELLRKATKQWFRSVCWEIWGKITELLFTSHWRPNTHKINFPVTLDEYDTSSLKIYLPLYR